MKYLFLLLGLILNLPSKALPWSVKFQEALTHSDPTYGKATMETLSWFFEQTITLLCLFMFFMAANRLKEEKYLEGFKVLAGAVFLGIAPQIAHIFVF